MWKWFLVSTNGNSRASMANSLLSPYRISTNSSISSSLKTSDLPRRAITSCKRAVGNLSVPCLAIVSRRAVSSVSSPLPQIPDAFRRLRTSQVRMAARSEAKAPLVRYLLSSLRWQM